MRLAEDTRARVPFALVGVLLLVGSATFAGTLATRASPTVDRSVERAMEHATASTQTALRGAVQQAGKDASAQPLIEPANTTTGKVIDDSAAFREYLRLRIYLTARERLESTSVRVGDVRATPSLSPTANASSLRRATERVHIEPVGNATESGLRVRIENITLRAYRDESVVAETARNITVVVETPVLALHERVRRYETRLNRDPFEPGLGRRLTARLYATTWARGYAQYGGAPIGNVLANRHVELMANGAMLEEQRNAFGRSDPAGRNGLRRATARVGLSDVLIPTTERGTRWTDIVLETAGPLADEPQTISGPTNTTYSPEDGMVVGVNESADRALFDLIGEDEASAGSEKSQFDTALESAYEVPVRTVATVRTVRDESPPEHRSPGKNWTLVGQKTDTRRSVESVDGRHPGTPPGWHLLWTADRRVTQTHVTTDYWKREDGTNRTTTRRWSDEFVVSLGVAGDHTTTEFAPERPLPTAHESGGPFSGANIADIERKAVDTLVSARGGPDSLAKRAVDGTLDTRPKTVQGRLPTELREWAYRDVRELRNRIENRSTTVSRGAVASGKTNPTATLASDIRTHSDELVDAPPTYDSTAERARYAVRAAYIDAVSSRLDSRAERTEHTQQGFSSAVRDATDVPLDRVREILDSRKRVESPTRNPLPTSGPGAPTNLSVDGAPAYLTLSAVEHDHVSAVPRGESAHPMSARNVNLFAVPAADVTDGIVSLLPDARDEKRMSLRDAALTLKAANRTLSASDNESLRRQRNDLQRSLRRTNTGVRKNLADSLETTDLSWGERWVAIRRGLARWETTADRSLALSNGSAAEPVAAELEAQGTVQRTQMQRDRLTIQIQVGLETARSETKGVKESAVEPASKTLRQIVEGETKRLAKQAIEKGVEGAQKKWVNETMASLAAGLPVAPVPGYWYATVNVWQVDVSGTYARFTVRARHGSPVSPGASVAYTRQSQAVRLDFDGDGSKELFGRTTPISFDTWTTVIIAVPPGKRGVGDVNGDADERSPGWSNRSNNPFDSRALRGEHALR
ncbi:hypothetical protein SAMN05421858_0796 [Haladaptatus litoreus]|uniref:Uncharacterized protein n=1 Tax=Haladaptatus litoreus TaxID=553468 RepID=A0A1N6WMZ3_9EURY|nr:hypothetical protein [Haladaptatus litoreus]SIQ91416.1 hypothetical protein SAMN05421858_0796 [Haladaptatus litoreus]